MFHNQKPKFTKPVLQNRIRKELTMSVRKWPLLLSSALLPLALLSACSSPKNPPEPKWTTENPSASSGQASAQKPSATKPDGSSQSSLDALRSGQPAGSGPLKEAYFAFDSYDLSQEARATLKANAEWLKANPQTKVQIEGHCDERGTNEYNMALGAKRAQAAMDYLSTLGVSAQRLSTVSYGEEVPVCKEQTEECWAKNRRDRFVVSAGGPTS
jgi:peptidoglycan-associated lipoprotein